jgi:acylphosphatase
MTMDNHRLHARVYGLVQGVYFRDTTRQNANALKITGWVRNLLDGSVEVLAEGPRPALDTLLKFLHSGPPHARVERVETEWGAATGEFTGFAVRP